MSGLSEFELLRTFVNGRSKRRLRRDLSTGLAESLLAGISVSVGWIFIGNESKRRKKINLRDGNGVS